MNTTEELDDFELAIRDKLANYELTPPVGTWNNIVNTQSAQSRKMRIVWFNNSSFLLVFLCSTFTMWLAFGSIDFGFNDYKNQEEKLLGELKKGHTLSPALNENNLFTSQIKDRNGIGGSNEFVEGRGKSSSGFSINEEEVIVSNEELSSNVSPIKSIEEFVIQSEIVAQELTVNSYHTEAVKIKPMFHWNISSNAGSHILFNNKLLADVDDKQLSNGKTSQVTNRLELNLSYGFTPRVRFNAGLGVSNIYQKNNFIQSIESKYHFSDTIILGYIQDPVIGRVPVYEITEKEVTNIEKKSIEFINKFYAVDLPFSIDWNILRKNRFSVSLNAGARITHLFSNDYLYLNKEGIVETSHSFNKDIFTTYTGVELDYSFNRNISTYLNTNYLKSTSSILNNGVGFGLGVKYKFY